MSDKLYPCHAKPREQWCDRDGRGGFMGHTCDTPPIRIALTLDERLILLIEECGEVIQAATKCLRFGYNRDQPGYGVNSDVLSKEVGELLGVVGALPLSDRLMTLAKLDKMDRAERVKAQIGRKP